MENLLAMGLGRDAEAPTAVFAANDVMAIGALLAAREAGLRVPDDVSIAGFDGIPMAEVVDPPLTTVQQPIYELGRKDRKSTRLNSSHVKISYAVFCLKKKNTRP